MSADQLPVEVEVRRGVMRPGWYWWLALFASCTATGAIALVVAIHVNTESDRKWCSIVTTLDDSYRETPPSTPAGVNLAAAIADLRRSLECPPA